MFSEFCLFFFFKQKTAYEMRISDWSSDVCSSDLNSDGQRQVDRPGHGEREDRGPPSPAHQNSRCTFRHFVPSSDASPMVRHRSDGTPGGSACSCANSRRDGCVPSAWHEEWDVGGPASSEERRVGKEWVSTCRSRWS